MITPSMYNVLTYLGNQAPQKWMLSCYYFSHCPLNTRIFISKDSICTKQEQESQKYFFLKAQAKFYTKIYL